MEVNQCPHCGLLMTAPSAELDEAVEAHHVEGHGCPPDEPCVFDPWVWAHMFNDGFINNEVVSTDYQVVTVEDEDEHPDFPHVHYVAGPIERITNSVEGPLGRPRRLPRGRVGYDGKVH